MNASEQRLRTELRSESELITPESVRPLDLPGRGGRRATKQRTVHDKRLPGWLTPVSAAAAVAIVIAGTVAVSTLVFGNPPKRGGPAPTSYARLPAYYAQSVQGNVVSYTWNGTQYGTSVLGRYIKVRATATGKVVTTVMPPKPYNDFFSLTGTADGRTFVFGAERFRGFLGPRSPKNGTLDASAPVRFVMLHITPGGQPKLSVLSLPLAILPLQQPSIALSPDGTKLAVAYGGGGQTALARVVTLTTGQVREWQWPHASWTPLLQVQGAWTADDRTVVLQEWYVNRGSGQTARLGAPANTTPAWLLNTVGPGSAATRLLLRAPAGQSAPWQTFLTPDGGELIATVGRKTGNPLLGHEQGEFVVYSARTGTLLRTISSWAWPGGRRAHTFARPGILWSDASGSQVVVIWPFLHVNHLAVLIDGTVALGGSHLFPRNHNAYAELQRIVQGAFGIPPGMTW